MSHITVNGNTVDPTCAEHVSKDAKDSNFIYIQGYQDLLVEQKQQLAVLDVVIQEYVSEHTYLCHYKPINLDRIRALDFVRSANIYHAELKCTVTLKDMVNLDADQSDYEVDLILHDNPNIDATALASHVAQAAGVPIDELEVMPNKIRLTVDQDKLGALAALDSINRIEEVREKAIFNDHASGILHTDTLFTATGYRGSNQMVCVADTGFDQGLKKDGSEIKVHPAFAGRIEYLTSLWTVGDFKDPTGHGTHVCASICGSGTYKGSEPGKEIKVSGTAPAAKLMVQSLAKSIDGKRWTLDTPVDLATSLFPEPYDLGIRIHNNSWGNRWNSKTGQFGYEGDATAIDRFVSDHPDFVVLVAAGNNAQKTNHGASQVGANAVAKNCITVGATGTTRPNDGQRYDSQSPAISGIGDTAIFSSRGPTKSTLDSRGQKMLGRIKPDVVAPGVAILSAASRSVAPTDKVRSQNGPSDDQDWLFMSGTSQATPLIAGCVALLREALKESGKEKPSAALNKALLVNGAVNHSSSNDLGYDYEQGFGLVDIDKSIAMIRQSTFIEGGSMLETTKWDVPALRLIQPVNLQWESEALSLPSGPNRLVATLAYPDAPGALLQSGVNLIARAGDVERHGNMGTGAEFDQTNNVEKIIWDNVPGTTVSIIARVSGLTKFDLEQAFAVVWDIQAL